MARVFPRHDTEERIKRLQKLVAREIALGYYPLSMFRPGEAFDQEEQTRPAPRVVSFNQSGGASAVGQDATPAGLFEQGEP